MTVLPGTRFPVIGTSMALLGATGVRILGPFLKRMSFINLEFHAIDLLDADDVPGSPLIGRQPDLARRVQDKRAAYTETFRLCGDAVNATLEQFSQQL